MASPGNYKVVNNSYFERKMEALKNFGKAKTRPQENFRNYLLVKRRINFGYLTRKNWNIDKIKKFHVTIDQLQESESLTGLQAVNQPNFVLVSNREEFRNMMKELTEVKEITLALEGNSENSYCGMTCLIQIGTLQTTYLIDPFPVFDLITNNLRLVLESNSVMKIMHGCAKDVIALNRDFGISIAGVVDTQLIQKQLALIVFHLATVGKSDNVRGIDYDEILHRQIMNIRTGCPLSIRELEKLTHEGIGLEELT